MRSTGQRRGIHDVGQVPYAGQVGERQLRTWPLGLWALSAGVEVWWRREIRSMPHTVSRPGFEAGDPISTAAQVDHPQSALALPTIVDEEPRSPGSIFALVAGLLPNSFWRGGQKNYSCNYREGGRAGFV